MPLTQPLQGVVPAQYKRNLEQMRQGVCHGAQTLAPAPTTVCKLCGFEIIGSRVPVCLRHSFEDWVKEWCVLC